MTPYAAGWAHFAAGRWFEAHDAWEALWLVDRSEARSFLQGLIQIAAAFHHLERGRSVPGARLLERGTARLRAYPSPYKGLDVTAFLAALEAGERPLVACSGPPADPHW